MTAWITDRFSSFCRRAGGRWSRPLAACLVASVVAACDDAPTDPNEVFVLEGVLETGGVSENDFVLGKAGVAEVVVSDLSALLVEVPPNPDADAEGPFPTFVPVVGLGVGENDAEGSCSARASFTVAQGDSYFFSLEPGVHCVTVFDSGLLPESAQIGYAVLVEVTR